jgi:hypothetical protein
VPAPNEQASARWLSLFNPPAMPAVDDTSFAAAKSRVETALGFVKSLTRAQVDGAEGKVIAWTGGGNDRKMKGNDYLQQFALPNFFFFVTTAYNILLRLPRSRNYPLLKKSGIRPNANWSASLTRLFGDAVGCQFGFSLCRGISFARLQVSAYRFRCKYVFQFPFPLKDSLLVVVSKKGVQDFTIWLQTIGPVVVA